MLRLAMWSGPRNLSTALMRAWENRSDCAVVDEPLYAHYLAQTGLLHPGRAEILRSQSQAWPEVTEWLASGEPAGAKIWYQKHMSHHLLPSIGRDWMQGLTHCLLIRDPRLVLSSYVKSRDEVRLEDLGFTQQMEIFDYLVDTTGAPPLVISSRDILEAPEAVLCALCDAVGVSFEAAMLRWPAGRRESDGVWAPHWYANVEASTGFQPYRPKTVDYPLIHQSIVDAAMPVYEFLWEKRLRATPESPLAGPLGDSRNAV